MDFILRHRLDSDDIDFLNSTIIEFEIINTHGLKPGSYFDSGWCDMDTGSRIISDQDRVIFRNVCESDKTFLTLKYGERLKSLTNDIQCLYNEAYVHNVSPNSVIDSETVI